MKITLINGSPKTSKSATEVILNTLRGLFSADAQIQEFKCNKDRVDEPVLEMVAESDVLIFAFPLYVDGIPSHLIHCLTQLETSLNPAKTKKIRVYAIVNCGFYEGHQANIALEMMKNWCVKTGVQWGQGVGIGGGGMLASLQGITMGQGPTKNLWEALNKLVRNVTASGQADNLYTVPNFPRVLYSMGGNMGWRKQIKANGLESKDLHTKK